MGLCLSCGEDETTASEIIGIDGKRTILTYNFLESCIFISLKRAALLLDIDLLDDVIKIICVYLETDLGWTDAISDNDTDPLMPCPIISQLVAIRPILNIAPLGPPIPVYVR